jgi:hypothetical protein
VKANDYDVIGSTTFSTSPYFGYASVVNLNNLSYPNFAVITQNMSSVFYVPLSTNYYEFKETYTVVFSYGGYNYQPSAILTYYNNTAQSGIYELSHTSTNNFSIYARVGNSQGADSFSCTYGVSYDVSIRTIVNYTTNLLSENVSFFTVGYLDNSAYSLGTIGFQNTINQDIAYLNVTSNWLSNGDFAQISNHYFYQVSSQISFQYQISPTPILTTLNVYSTLRATEGLGSVVYDFQALYYGTTYTVNCQVYTNSSLNSNGTFTVSSAGLSLVSTSLNYIPVASGTITNGEFAFGIAPRNNPNPEIYENLDIYWNITTSFSNQYILIKYSIPPPPDQPTNYNFGYTGDITGFIVPLIFILVPTLFLTIYLGKNGFLVGLSLSVGLCAMINLVPIWFVFLTGLCLVLLIFTNDVGGIRERF